MSDRDRMNRTPALLLAAPASGSGKTAAACALMQAFLNRGLAVRGAKCGPDYIDPMFHREILGIASRNLDLFFQEREELIQSFRRHSQEGDLTIVEGVMGYYDGMTMDSPAGSSYDVAAALGLPVILILPGRGAALSLGAVAAGMVRFRPDSNIRGILLNRISPGIYPALKRMLERELKEQGMEIPVLGYLPENEAFQIESRHLGLILPEEIRGCREQAEQAARILEETVDLDQLIQIAGEGFRRPGLIQKPREEAALLRIGIARDPAFCFYYEDNLELLESLGCALVPFSPVADQALPENLDGLLLGGGYPELYAEQLGKNNRMRQAIREALEQGMPCIAECGGFMYLHEELQDPEGRIHPMAGFLSGRCFPAGRLVRFGFVHISPAENQEAGQEILHGWLQPGERIRGHEFHYWDSTDPGESCLAAKPDGRRQWKCVHVRKNLFAGYPHLYLPSARSFARRYVEKCRRWEEKGKKK